MSRFPMPGSCPVCNGPLTVTRLDCAECGTRIEGQFGPGRLGRLSREQLAFVEVFLRNRGVIKDVESDLGLSYPTIRARLDDVVRAMGYGESLDEKRAQKTRDGSRGEQRRAILEDLRAGKISADEAAVKMRQSERDGDLTLA